MIVLEGFKKKEEKEKKKQFCNNNEKIIVFHIAAIIANKNLIFAACLQIKLN